MSYPLSLTEDAIMTALRAFILSIMPAGFEAVQGQDNYVTMPAGSDFIIMTPAKRVQISQTTHDYTPPAIGQDAGTEEIGRSTVLHFQLDTYGPSASDNIQVLTTLFRDDFGFQFFRQYGISPLFCDDGQQMPLVSGEKTYIQRWMMRGVLQTNLDVVIPVQFAENVVTTLKEYQ